MDLIDRQALLKQIDIDSDGEPGYYGDTWKFIDTIKSMPSATDINVGTKLGIDPHKIERAIRGLTEWQKHVQTESDIDRDISVAVEALKAQLGTDLAEVGTDCISRQSAIDAFNTNLNELVVGGEKNAKTVENYLNRVLDKIKCLPPAQPKRGKWIKTARWGRVYYCNQCRNYLDFDGVNAGRGSTNFCPNCGADMRGEQDDS